MLPDSSSNAVLPVQPLRGRRVVVTDLDLQQREHRGIAVYSKALLKALKEAGAEIWLLTDFDPPLKDARLNTLPASARELIYAARVMSALMHGPEGLQSPYVQAKLIQRSRLGTRLWRLWQKLQILPEQLRRRSTYNADALRGVNLHAQVDNPYFRLEKLDYFEQIDGILCARYLYLNASRMAMERKPKPLKLKLGKHFDALITTCPLNIATSGSGACVQTVHDLIPLEYVQTTDYVPLFGQRLASCVSAKKLFVSASTQHKFEKTFSADSDAGGAVVMQPPSLRFPDPHKRRLLDKAFLQPTKSGNRKTNDRHEELEPFRYLLFNSSVESRKNLLFAIKAYRLSGLAERGIRLCVTGQLKTDAYSQEVAQQADRSVLLTGYIDETTKADLFLHALAVLSPSLVEGFGIPVLDGACVGAPVIASPSSSHREIQELHDFRELVWICDTTNPYDWGLAIRDLGIAELARIEDPSVERQRRLNRYDAMSGEIFEAFKATVCEQVLEGIHNGSHPEPVKTAHRANPIPFRARSANNAAHS